MLEHMKAKEFEKAMNYMDFETACAKAKKDMEKMSEEEKKMAISMMGDMSDPENLKKLMVKMLKEELKDKKLDYEVGEAKETKDGNVEVKVTMKIEGEEEDEQNILMRKVKYL